MNSANSDGLEGVRSELRQRIENGEAWLVNAKKVDDWLEQSDESGIWTALGSYPVSSLDDDGGVGGPLGNLKLTLDLLGALKNCSDYLNAGMVIARANGGILDPDQGVDLIQWMPWCKASNRRSLRKNLIHRLKKSGLFEEAEGGDLILKEMASRYQSVDEELQPLSGEDDADLGEDDADLGEDDANLGDDLPTVEVAAVNGAIPVHSVDG